MVVLTRNFLLTFFFTPNGINAYTDGRNIYLFMGGLGLKNLTGLLIPLFFFLLFLGLSHTIRYLLALKDTLQKQQLAQQE